MSKLLAGRGSLSVVILRGGTSRGLYLHARDLPAAGAPRDRLLARLMGSPDTLQIDGLGGSRPITSKVAIVAPSTRSDADLDYTFAQVDIASGAVGYAGNCGNISAGVGPFAIDEGLIAAKDGVTRVRIHNTNTGKVLIADVPVIGGLAAEAGDYEVPGVPGTGAEIVMNWKDTVGAASGRLLPTGAAIDRIEMEDGRQIAASLVDAANPCVWVRGAEFGLTGAESQKQINGDARLREELEEVRGKAAALYGFADTWRNAAAQSAGLPMLGMVSAPIDYQAINGRQVRRAEMDVRLHLMFMGVLHESVAGTGSICFAAASRIPGSVVNQLTQNTDLEVLRLGHPSGVTPTRVKARAVAEAPFIEFDDLGFSRTARRIMEGRAFFPKGLIEDEA